MVEPNKNKNKNENENENERKLLIDSVYSALFDHLKYVFHRHIIEVKKKAAPTFDLTKDPELIELVLEEETTTIGILGAIWEHKKDELENQSNNQLNAILSDLSSGPKDQKPDFASYYKLYEEIKIITCSSASFTLIQEAVFGDEEEAAAKQNKDNSLDVARLDVSISEAAAAYIASSPETKISFPIYPINKGDSTFEVRSAPAEMEEPKHPPSPSLNNQQTTVTHCETPAAPELKADPGGVEAIADLVNAAQGLDFTAPPAVLLVQPSSTKPFDLWECCIDIANESPESPRSHYAFRLKETPENKYLFEEPGRIRQIIGSMEPKAAKYIFQMESSSPMSHIDGVASYGQISQRHYQGFIKFNKKVRAKRLITQLKLRYSGLNNALEFVGVLDEGLFVRYSKKKDGRLDGPWAYPPEAF